MDQLKQGLYVITEDHVLDFDSLLSKTETILDNNISALQYRKKNATYLQKFDEASALKSLCIKYNTPFIINDDIKLATEIGADGIHLGEQDESCQSARSKLGKNKLIGISCYNDSGRAEQAIRESADYIAFGAMYKTETKKSTKNASPQLLIDAKKRFSVPLVAIGGITPQNAQALLSAGADLLAVVSCVYHADRPDMVIKEFKKLFENYYESI